jgi:hypothetical protein
VAKDDYFVIAYKILRYLYACLKADKPPDTAVFDASAFGITQGYWQYIMVNLHDGGFVIGALLIPPTLGDGRKRLRVSSATTITPKGIQYLDDNSMFEKVRGIIKDVADVIP